MKGSFSCHSFTAQGRDNYEEIFRMRKRHQQICQEIEAMQLPTAHETVSEYSDRKPDSQLIGFDKETEPTEYDMRTKDDK